MDKATFDNHIKTEHSSSTLSTYLEECVYGGTDGIVTTFAVVAGFSGANLGEQTLNLSIITVLLFGLANLIADGAAMGLGNYLSIKSAKSLYKSAYQKELSETQESYDYEIEETEFLFQEQGFNEKDSKQLTKIISKNTDFWIKFMIQHECNLENMDNVSATKNGLATFLSFIIFGFIPLTPYFFTLNQANSFSFSIGCTGLALVILGIIRAKVANENMLKSIIETSLIGGLAASLAFIVGSLFKH
tara:strand:+ start:10271 stop:11008 length:738 start_codon:yes stop_codon:yes gene_type:complete